MSKEYPCVYYDHEKCTLHGTEPDCIDWCVMGPCSKETPSNADHIRSMTDEELAEFMCDATYKENEQGYPIMRTVNKVWWHKWLKQPYKEDA